MGQTLAIPTYGVCSLDALGHAAAATGQRILVASDARRREIYWAVYGDAGKRITEPDVAAPAVVAGQAAGLGITVAVGEGAHRYADILGLPLRAELLYPPAYALAELAAERIRAGDPGESLTPLYLRRPDAVAASIRKPVLP